MLKCLILWYRFERKKHRQHDNSPTESLAVSEDHYTVYAITHFHRIEWATIVRFRKLVCIFSSPEFYEDHRAIWRNVPVAHLVRAETRVPSNQPDHSEMSHAFLGRRNI